MNRTIRRVLITIVIYAALAAWFLCPLPGPSAIKTDVVDRHGLPSSVTHDVRFACGRASDQIEIKVVPAISQGRLDVDVLDAQGKVLMADPLVVTGDKGDHLTLVTDGGFAKGQTFQLRCREYEVLGTYRLSISQPRVLTIWQRYLAGLAVLIAGWAVTGISGLFGIGGERVRRLCRVFVSVTFLASFWLVYAVVHEVGHILVLTLMGEWDPSRTDVCPVDGQLPHVAGSPTAQLAPYQLALVAVAGPLLPTLVGYASFAIWRSRFGRRWRERHFPTDVRWSLLTVVMLFPFAVATPISLVLPDRDHSLFFENVGLPLWITTMVLTASALVSLTMVAWIIRHVVLRVRMVRSA